MFLIFMINVFFLNTIKDTSNNGVLNYFCPKNIFLINNKLIMYNLVVIINFD